MARELKPMKMETFIDRDKGVTIDLMLNRNTKRFFAEVQLEEIVADSIDKLRDAVRKKIESWKPLAWRQVIELHVDQPSEATWGRTNQNLHHNSRLSFGFKRLELAESMNGELLDRPFIEDLDERDQERQKERPLAFTEMCPKWRVAKQIPYTAEAWSTLCELERATKTAREKLVALFDPKDKGQLLASRAPGSVGSVLQLGAGKETP